MNKGIRVRHDIFLYVDFFFFNNTIVGGINLSIHVHPLFIFSLLKFDFKVQVYWHPSCGLLPLPPVPHPAPLLSQPTCAHCQSFCQEQRSDGLNGSNKQRNTREEATAPFHDMFGDIYCCCATHRLSTVTKTREHIQQTHAQITFNQTLSSLWALSACINDNFEKLI